MKKLFVITTVLVLFIYNVYAQSSTQGSMQREMPEFTITGKVIDSITQNPIEFAVIALYQAKDSSLVNGTTTDINGNFNLKHKGIGNFYIKISFVGYANKTVSDILLNIFLKTPFSLKWEVVVIAGWLFVVATQNLLKGKKLLNAIIMELSGSVVFYFVTNSLVFFFFDFYPKNYFGYITCMAAGIPFLRNQAIYNFFLSFVVYYTVNWLLFSYEKKELQV